MFKSTITLALAAALVACGGGGGGDEPIQTSGPQTRQPPITKGAATDTPVQPETGDEASGRLKTGLM
ncbi:MAG: hypothetical protein ABWY27_02425 [Telluria sp.]